MKGRILLGGIAISATMLSAASCGASQQQDAPGATADQVTEISHSRTGCLGRCPAYSVTFRISGMALFRGDADVSPLGEHAGVISREDFDRLVAEAVQARFFELQSAYEVAFDVPHCYTQITRGTRTKEVISPCGALPGEFDTVPSGLLRLEDAIDAFRMRVVWKGLEAQPK